MYNKKRKPIELLNPEDLTDDEDMDNVEFGKHFFSRAVEKRLSKTEEVFKPMQRLRHNIEGIKKHCRAQNQDWITMVVGGEGTGKSTIGRHIADMFDHKFQISKQMVYSFNDELGYLDFIDRYRRKPFRAVIFDEAVTSLFSRDHARGEIKDAVKMFNLNRQLNHFTILIVPSFWSIDLDLRERRTKSLIYVFMDPYTSQRKFAYYSRLKVAGISSSGYARKIFLSPKLFLKHFKPDFVEAFPRMSKKKEEAYLKLKRDNFSTFLGELHDKYDKKKIDKKTKPKGGK